MPELTWIEDGESRQATIVRRGKNATSTYVKSYKVFGTSDDTQLHSDINQKISSNGYGWQYPGVSDAILWVEQYSVAYLGDDAWQVTISYEKKGAKSEDSEPARRTRAFDTSGGTQHITQAYTETKYPGSAPDQQKAIGVDENGVNGVDIVVPQLQWTETYDVPNAYVTNGYIKGVSAITGCVNVEPFRGFDPGEVLFLGCTGSHEWNVDKGDGPWSLSFRFVASRNKAEVTIGSVSGIEKKGHQYLWVRYESAVDSSTLIKKPKHVYVNTVYSEASFAALGIGDE